MDFKTQFEPGQRVVFYVSDRTGLTAETYGKNLLAQFPELEYQSITLAFISRPEKAQHAIELIDTAREQTGVQPIVITSLVRQEEQEILNQCRDAIMIDLFNTFLGPLEESLGMQSAHTQGNSRKVLGSTTYQRRLDAIDFCLAHDDGVRPDHYDEADVILCGVSRCGKTPTSLYLAMNFSLKVANYPLTEEDLANELLPTILQQCRNKLIALTIDPEALSKIREKRRPGSRYGSIETCRHQVDVAMNMFRLARLPVFETTDTSIEEVASNVVKTLGLSRERLSTY